MFHNIKDRLDDPIVLQLLAASSYENSMERAAQKAEEYRTRHNWSLFGWIENGEIVGSCGYKVYHTDRVEIMSIAVAESSRKRGIGSAMVNALRDEFLLPIYAETDDDAVGFYSKVGFETTSFVHEKGYKRWACVLAAPAFIKTIEGLDASKVTVSYMPEITEKQMWEFYIRNDICETGYGKDVAVKALRYGNSHYVAAFYEDELVGIIRGLFDGLAMRIVEWGLELSLQGGISKYENGCLMENDIFGIFKQMGLLFLSEAEKLGSTFVDMTIVQNLEESVVESLGMKHNTGHLPYYIDIRPYVQED
jgi:N-acetylglutamate synthase-like GNAT family acetyltransferase